MGLPTRRTGPVRYFVELLPLLTRRETAAPQRINRQIDPALTERRLQWSRECEEIRKILDRVGDVDLAVVVGVSGVDAAQHSLRRVRTQVRASEAPSLARSLPSRVPIRSSFPSSASGTRLPNTLGLKPISHAAPRTSAGRLRHHGTAERRASRHTAVMYHRPPGATSTSSRARRWWRLRLLSPWFPRHPL